MTNSLFAAAIGTHGLNDVTVIVVSFNSAHCMPRLGELLQDFPHVIIVDNGSEDDCAQAVVEHLPQAIWLPQGHNLGFGAANNRALTLVRTPFALMLNPDCELDAQSVVTLLNVADQFPEAALVAPQLMQANGNPEVNYRWPSGHWTSSGPQATGICCVGFICGAAILARMSLFAREDWFDERFFLYYEDDDLCLRLFRKQRGMLLAPHIHASAEELNRVYQADLAICATMNAAARSLEVLTAPAQLPWAPWAKQANADYLANLQPQSLPGPIDMPAVVQCLQKHLPEDAVLTNGAGNFASWVHRFYQHPGLAQGHKVQLAPTSGAMGYGVPAGIAANLLTGRLAFTIAGDGDFLMTGQELATASQHGGKSIIVLLNNGMYGTIRMHQEREYPAHVSGSSLNNPDFAALARAYGYQGVRITQTAEFEPALRQALTSDQGTLIEVMLDPEVITTRTTLSAIRQAAQAKR